MLLALASPARGRSHATMGSEDNYAYGYDESHVYYDNYNNSDNAYNYDVSQRCNFTIDSNPGVATAHYLPLVVYPILLVQGIVGNLLAIPILLSVSKRAWSTAMYLACLAGTDLIILLIHCGNAWYNEAVGVNVSQKIMNSSDAACKAYNFSFLCVQHMNPWLVVAISVDMMIAMRWPRRTYTMCTLERARNVLLLMSILVICLDINIFWTYGVPNPGLSCMYTEEFSLILIEWIWPALDNAIGTFFPLLIVSVCFFFTASTMIRRSAAAEKDLETEMKKYFLELATLRDFRMICFILCLVFMCLGVFKVTYFFTTFLISLGYLDEDCVTQELFKTLCKTLTFLFYGAKIYLYIAFSSMFRVKLKQGFIRAFRRLETFVRTVSRCGYKWTPVAPLENSADRGKQQSQDSHSL